MTVEVRSLNLFHRHGASRFYRTKQSGCRRHCNKRHRMTAVLRTDASAVNDVLFLVLHFPRELG